MYEHKKNTFYFYFVNTKFNQKSKKKKQITVQNSFAHSLTATSCNRKRSAR